MLLKPTDDIDNLIVSCGRCKSFIERPATEAIKTKIDPWPRPTETHLICPMCGYDVLSSRPKGPQDEKI